MWLKCVLHLEILHPPGDLPLQSLISLELTPVHHLIRLLLLRDLLLLAINLYGEAAIARYPLPLLALKPPACLHRMTLVHVGRLVTCSR
jgi:hypothetical protein